MNHTVRSLAISLTIKSGIRCIIKEDLINTPFKSSSNGFTKNITCSSRTRSYPLFRNSRPPNKPIKRNPSQRTEISDFLHSHNRRNKDPRCSPLRNKISKNQTLSISHSCRHERRQYKLLGQTCSKKRQLDNPTRRSLASPRT